ncbi:hypothetical protein [Halorhabdus rudnickae]|uniref:hypothetical protein n=1 Tax=Halorhabdus rudnickae TaxID=1775544 RepID=UPI0014383E2F|nr:hypothetical protein [Halorhabdus rudnickae]
MDVILTILTLVVVVLLFGGLFFYLEYRYDSQGSVRNWWVYLICRLALAFAGGAVGAYVVARAGLIQEHYSYYLVAGVFSFLVELVSKIRSLRNDDIEPLADFEDG